MFEDLKECYLIAEIGVNHEGKLDVALRQIASAKSGGASAVKFQTYKANKLAAQDSPAYWDQSKESTPTQHQLFQKYDNLEEADYKKLAEYCKMIGLDFSSTPFDTDCLPWLIPLMPFVKVASADLTNDILLEAIAEYEKPVILSVGACRKKEIDRALDILSPQVREIVLLHCVLNYPTMSDNAFLERISVLKSLYGHKYEIGYSDHVAPSTAGDDQIILSRGMGVRIFEKHFTHDKSLKGNDHYHAMDETDLKNLRSRLNLADQMINLEHNESDFLKAQSEAIINARRSLYYKSDLKAGCIIKKENLVPKRPGTGLEVSHYKSLLGHRVLVDVKADDQVSLSHFHLL